MSDKHFDDIGEKAAHYALAKGSIEKAARYIQDGRRFKDLDAVELRAVFETSFRSWVLENSSEGRRQNDDAQAEFELRSEEPPFDGLREELDILIGRATNAVANPEVAERVGKSIVEEYLDDLDKQQ